MKKLLLLLALLAAALPSRAQVIGGVAGGISGSSDSGQTITPSTVTVTTSELVDTSGGATLTSGNDFQVGGGTLAVTTSGHITYTGTAPATASCNSRTVNTGSNDHRGSITFAGGAQSSCQINFVNLGGVTTPFCTCSDASNTTAVKCLGGSGNLTLSIAVAANDTLTYICNW